MAVFRVEKSKNYTVMCNHHLRNKNLSLKSKGLLSLMLSLPEDWHYSIEGLAKINKEGVDAIRCALLELEKEGYIIREKLHDEHGKFKDTLYTIYEIPVIEEKKEEETKKEANNAPISFEQAKKYHEQCNMLSDFKKWWAYWEKKKWKYKEEPLSDWKRTLNMWEYKFKKTLEGKKQLQNIQNKTSFHNFKQRDIDMDDLEKRVLLYHYNKE